jgi:DNA damage-binding protein 1
LINGKEETGSSGRNSERTKGTHTSEEPLSLQPECGHHGHIMTLYLKTHGDYVLVGDLLRSVTLLQYKAANHSLEEVSRDYNSNYMRAVEMVGDDEHFLGADDNGNLFMTRRQLDAETDEERGKLESQGGFHLGDYVNVFCRGSLSSQHADQDAVVAGSSAASSSSRLSTSPLKNSNGLANVAGAAATSILFGTIFGAIGTLITLNHEAYLFFNALERAIKIVVPPVGGLSHDDWRSFNNERRSYSQRNMVDGDLVEQFSDLDREQLEQVVRQMNDDLAATKANNTISSASNFGTSSSLHTLLSGEKIISMLTVEEVTRRVEDMARLH